MKFVRLGIGADGRSTVVETQDVAEALIAGPDAGSAVVRLWMTQTQPPQVSVPRRRPDDHWFDTGLAPGAAQWAIFSLDPESYNGQLHHTASIDFIIVLSGKVTLALENGDVMLEAGDSALIPGVSHKWVAGAEGCVISVFMCGLDAAK